jgi:hypothetical protein
MLTDTSANEISEVTRRSIFDSLSTAGTSWSGRLDEDDFLARLYDLTKMRSTDSRMRNAAGDIHQHRVNWRDWEDDWIFHDSRFNLLRAPDHELLRFLCETVHPVVRPDDDEARSLVEQYNAELERDGWRLVESTQISGRPVFAPERLGHRAVVFDEPTGWQKVDRQLQEVRLRLDTAESEEQYQAVGLLCREVLISVGQQVFDRGRHPLADGIEPSDTDAKRMLEAIFTAELSGSANEEARAHARAALRLALALQHKRTADFRMAALCPAMAERATTPSSAMLTPRVINPLPAHIRARKAARENCLSIFCHHAAGSRHFMSVMDKLDTLLLEAWNRISAKVRTSRSGLQGMLKLIAAATLVRAVAYAS